jgi:hypothetical protein
MSKKINIVACLNDEIKQLDWLNATDMSGDLEVQHYMQTKEGKYYKKEDFIGYTEKRLENIKAIELEDILQGVNEISITSEGSIDGSVISFSGVMQNGQPIWELNGEELGVLLGKTIAGGMSNDIKVILNFTGSGVKKTEKPGFIPEGSFMEGFAMAMTHVLPMSRGYSVVVEGRAGQVIHDNQIGLYNSISGYDLSLVSNLSKAELKIFGYFLLISYVYPEGISIAILEAYFYKDMLIAMGLEEEEVISILKDTKNASERVYRAIITNKETCGSDKFMLAPTISITNSRGIVSGANPELQGNNSGALGSDKNRNIAIIRDANRAIRENAEKGKYNLNPTDLLKVVSLINNIDECLDNKQYEEIPSKVEKLKTWCSKDIDRLGRMYKYSTLLSVEYDGYACYFSQSQLYQKPVERLCNRKLIEMKYKELARAGGMCYSLASFTQGSNDPEFLIKLGEIMDALGEEKPNRAPEGWEPKFKIDCDKTDKQAYKKFVERVENEIIKQIDSIQRANRTGNSDPVLGYILRPDADRKKMTRPELAQEHWNSINHLINKGKLKINESFMINFSEIKNGIDGHGHQCTIKILGEDKYMFIDPNGGVYEVNGFGVKKHIEVVMEFMERIFKADYCYLQRLEKSKDFHLDMMKRVKESVFKLHEDMGKKVPHLFPEEYRLSSYNNLGENPEEETWRVPSQKDIGILEGKPLASNEEKRIILQMQGDETSFKAVRDLFMKDPRNSNWVQGRDEFGGAVIGLEGDRLTTKTGFALENVRDIKLVLVGHGYVLEGSGETTLGSLSGKDISERLDRLFADKIKVGKPESLKISLVGCYLAEEGKGGLPKEVADKVYEIGKRLEISAEKIVVTAQKHSVRINSNGNKEILVGERWVLAKTEQLENRATKVTYRGTDKGMVEVPANELEILDLFK